MARDEPDSLDVTTLSAGYRDRRLTPVGVVESLLGRIERRGDDGVWLHRLPCEAVIGRAQALAALDDRARARLPLYGVPFAVKDNIDVAACPTTAACPAFAYSASAHAFVVQRLLDAGAILIGKTNLDQFATGLVGVRSPYGVCGNAFSPDHIPGGSSAGSAVAVAAGLVSFALGTDTAGSGRVPAAFNNIVGLKSTRGLLSTQGVVPACRSLDCVSIFALTCADAGAVLAAAQSFDADDPYSRSADVSVGGGIPWRGRLEGLTVAVPRRSDLEFFDDEASAAAFDVACDLIRELGAQLIEIDFSPFLEAAKLLYEGPWLAERYLGLRDLLARRPDAVLPVIREVVEPGARLSAAQAFEGFHRLAALKRKTETLWPDVNALLTPTAPTIYTVAEVEADPVKLNARLGTYTNFVNLLDLSAVAVPACLRADGLPFGVTLTAPAFSDYNLLAIAHAVHRAAGLSLGATTTRMPAQARGADLPGSPAREGFQPIVVCGAHMRGLPLNHQLLELGARFVADAATADEYRLFAFEHLSPSRPGLVRVGHGRGAAIEIEIWDLPSSQVGQLLQAVPPPLGLGSVVLADGRMVHGFICETHAVTAARDITEFGGWRQFLAYRGGGAAKSRGIMSHAVGGEA